MAARIEIPELERALSVVGLELDFPEELDVAPAVAAELAARPARRPLFRLRSLRLPVLRPPGLGLPDAVYVRDLTVGGAEVFLVYSPRAGIPAARETGVGLLVSEFTGDLYRPGLEKLSFGAKIERVRVDDSPGFWVEGGHGVTYLDRDGNVVGDDLRLAGSVLLWQRGTLTLRIE